MKTKRVYNIKGHAHELTFSCYHQYRYLVDSTSCSLFIEELEKAGKEFHFHIWAYVLMPTHVHLLIYPIEKDYNISKIMQSIKGKMSTRYRNLLKENNPELYIKMCLEIKGKKVFRFWQAGGGYDRNMWSAKAIHASIHYIEQNPVRAGLAPKAQDWLWSSAHAKMFGEGLIPDQLGIPVLMN